MSNDKNKSKSKGKSKAATKKSKGKPIVDSDIFYPPIVIASMLTMLLPNAEADGTKFGDEEFMAQLDSAIEMAKKSTGEEARLYREKVEALFNFFGRDNNDELLRNARGPIKLLLETLFKDPLTAWSPPVWVNQASIKDIFRLKPR